MEETGVVGIPWWGLPVWGCQIPWVRCRTWPSLGTIACLSRTFSYVLCVHSDNRVSRVSREVQLCASSPYSVCSSENVPVLVSVFRLATLRLKRRLRSPRSTQVLRVLAIRWATQLLLVRSCSPSAQGDPCCSLPVDAAGRDCDR